MNELVRVGKNIQSLTQQWEPILFAADSDIVHTRRNRQSRTVKQITGHLIDSATNNLHRIVHLQYQPTPLQFPDYANLGANDTWIAIQRYQEEDWGLLIKLWKYSNLHLAHVIGGVAEKSLSNVWISALGEEISLLEMIVDYPRHLSLHLSEIEDLVNCG